MPGLRLAATLMALGATAVGAWLVVESPSSSSSVYTSARHPVRNAAFYYGGTVDVRTPQTAATMSALRDRLGRPGLVVVSPGGTDEGDRNTVTNMQTLAHIPEVYRYVNLYSEPEGGSSDLALPGLGWTFCASGTTPPVARVVNGTPWYFMNPSSSQARTAVTALFKRLHDDGYTGVMIDRGQAATQFASYRSGSTTVKIWYRRSTCNGGKQTFADGFSSWAALAQTQGLKVLFNNGVPALVTPKMRPDPSNKDCQHAHWSKCPTLGDLWRHTNLVLNESATDLKDTGWARTYAGNKASESDVRHGYQTVALITTRNLHGATGQTKGNVFYEWSRIKLFNISVAVNTGEGGCPATNKSTPCNHYGFYPALTSINFGRPLASGPRRASCTKPGEVHCVWHRTYARGADVVNVSSTRKTVTVDLGTNGCRFVTDAYSGTLLSSKCISTVKVTLPPWSGRPLTYSTSRPS
jgi:hypothetical protein